MRPEADEATIAGVFIESFVTVEGKPFCPIEVALSDGRTFRAQLSPGEARKTALDWLQVAEAAVSDAAVWTMLTRKYGMDAQHAAYFVGELRTTRIDMPGVEEMTT